MNNMNRLLRNTLLGLLLGCTLTGKTQTTTVTDTIFDRKAHEEDFAFGADIGFVSQMESWGTKWLDKNGNQKDILQILKDQGINNVRLRVWVNPAGGWCGKADVVKMAKRAKAKGMGIMLSFHYSDSWADPGTQDRPAAWKEHTVEQLEQDVYDHTKDIITALQATGITPRWAQIGNETKRGMFYPTCQTNKGGTDNFARMLKAGIRACHDCDSTIKTIIHLPDGHDNSLYRNMFDALKSRGVKWDMIGMSAYPRWSHLDGPTMITKVMANIKDLEQRYGTKVMVVETGHYWNKPIEANQYLVGLMEQLIKNGDPGCFYWEPESMAGYDLGAWDQNTKRPTVAMDAYLGVKHTEVSWVIKASVEAPAQEETVSADSEVTLKAHVQHIRNRNVNVEFYLDKKKTATVTAHPYETTVAALKRGVHTLWGKATDSEKHTLITDTVRFFVGESVLLENSKKQDADQKGGTQQWGFHVQQGGHYLLVFHYDAEKLLGAVVTANTDSLAKIYFTTGSDAYLSREVEVADGGDYTLTLTSTSIGGLPDIKSLRIFPLDGQATPKENNLTGMEEKVVGSDDAITIYTLSGRRIRTTTERQLGISLGTRLSAVVMPSNCVGGTPYIVRKQRLK
jgi:arabinogalactan endo-1,4-beta-galactosidase